MAKPFNPESLELVKTIDGVDYVVATRRGIPVRIKRTDFESAIATTLGATIQNADCLVFKGVISQSGTNAPTILITKNTLGYVPPFSYLGAGNFRLTLSTALSAIEKAYPTIGQSNQGAASHNYTYVDENDLTKIIIQSKDVDLSTGINDALYYTPFCLEIYP